VAPLPALVAAPAVEPQTDPSSDPATLFGPSRCAGSKLLLCEDFESGTLDPAVWKAHGTPPQIEEGLAARGSRALHVVKPGNGLSYIRTSKPFPVARNRYFGRAFFYFRALPTAPMPYSHWTILAASGADRVEIRLGGQLQQGVNRLGVGTDNRRPEGTGDWTNSDRVDGVSYGVPEMRWMCLEWMHDGERHETRTWRDGVERTALATTAERHGGRKDVPFRLPELTSLWVGWQEYQPTKQRFELWVDEIALDGERIGCSR
jgi:hypothetical protein